MVCIFFRWVPLALRTINKASRFAALPLKEPVLPLFFDTFLASGLHGAVAGILPRVIT